MPSKPRKVHFVVSTHWDREWYESFQGFRYRLVSLMDELLDKMAVDERFAFFQTDGQSIILEDYLEIRPERLEQLLEFAEQGRLEIGPWYVLPDEFLVSGESLIRNIHEGFRVSSQFGTPARVGFVCDLFGHNSQMPQIFQGFGIDVCYLWRGINPKDAPAQFRWRGADGSEVLSHRFGPQWGYCDYDFRVRKGNLIDVEVSFDQLVEDMVAAVRLQADRVPSGSLILFDGGDHMEIEPMTPDVIERANQILAPEGFVIEMSTLSRFAADLKSIAKSIKHTLEGELREPSDAGDEQWLIPGVAASRIHLKQANRRCEDLLCFWAEPFAAAGAKYGLAGADSYLNTAWRWLLQNHPHDSICGCSVDQVHKDMEYRFDQCEEIGNLVLGDALKRMVNAVPDEVTKERFPLIVANALAFERDEPTDIQIEISADAPVFQEFFGFERKPGFRILDPEGREVPYQLLRQDLDRTKFYVKRKKFPAANKHHKIDVCARLTLPPVGTKTFWIETVQGPKRYLGAGLLTGHDTMENEFIAVEVFENGTIAIQDRQSDALYASLLSLEDCADIGDGWFHGVAVNDEVFSSLASKAAVSVVENGPLKATFRVEIDFQVPTHFDFHKMVRSKDRASLKVVHHITLRQGVRRLEVETEVHNFVRDHRLRVLFPTFIQADQYWADSQFDVIQRDIELRADNSKYKELEIETKPQVTWTAISGRHLLAHEEGAVGLAVVSEGLPESAVLDRGDRDIALTLLRGFQKAVFTDGNDGGQIPGVHRFRYWIAPFSGAPDPVGLGREGQRLAAGVRTAQAHPLDIKTTGASLPPVSSLISVKGDVLVSSVRMGEDDRTLLVRLWNPKKKAANVTISTPDGIVSAAVCDLLDQPKEALRVASGAVSIKCGSKQILTVRIEQAASAKKAKRVVRPHKRSRK